MAHGNVAAMWLANEKNKKGIKVKKMENPESSDRRVKKIYSIPQTIRKQVL